ncbi:hypothetical protein [Aquipuribacter sp. SD81]|uniref:hypothetical protein n=1 Tax=Aquipuribacter sp. SD81 TaxID=3127703 RepID=UPI0030171ACA
MSAVDDAGRAVVRAAAGLSQREKSVMAGALRDMGRRVAETYDGDAACGLMEAMAVLLDELRYAATPAPHANKLRRAEAAFRGEDK